MARARSAGILRGEAEIRGIPAAPGFGLGLRLGLGLGLELGLEVRCAAAHMPLKTGVVTSLAPSALSITRRSIDIDSGMVRMRS